MNYVKLLQAELQAMAAGFVAALPNILIAIVVLFITWLVSRASVSLADRIMDRTDLRQNLRNLLETTIRVFVWIAGVLAALAIALPSVTPASLIGGLGLGTVAIGFAFRDIFENFLAGVLVMLRKDMKIGDSIECEGIAGKIEHINLRESHIRQFSNELTIVPNSMLFKNPVKILNHDPLRRREITVGVAYDVDLEEAAKVIRQAVERCEHVSAEKPVDVYASAFNSSSVDFLVRWWTDDVFGSQDLVVQSIKRGLDEAGIEIPFPYITHTFKEPVPLPSKEDAGK